MQLFTATFLHARYGFPFLTSTRRISNAVSPEARKVSYNGNNVKSTRISTEASLQKLRTSYIDILYLHWWDFDTSVEEIVNRIAQPCLAGQGSIEFSIR